MLNTPWSSEVESSTTTEDLGLRVEVGARADEQLVHLDDASSMSGSGLIWFDAVTAVYVRLSEPALPPHCPRFSSSRSWRSTSASTSSGSWPLRARRSLRATTSWRTSSRRLRVVHGRRRRRCRRAAARPRPRCRAGSRRAPPGGTPSPRRIWRTSASRTSRETGAGAPPLFCGSSCSIANGPLPICPSAPLAPSAKLRIANGIATMIASRKTSPVLSATTAPGMEAG